MPDAMEELNATGIINCAAYTAGQRVADLPICDIQKTLKDTDRFVWIGLNEPSEAILRPELQWQFGYPLTMAIMLGTCAALFVGFRRSGWL